jgi:phosphoribosylaminoimidazole (AIR) synthetase
MSDVSSGESSNQKNSTHPTKFESLGQSRNALICKDSSWNQCLVSENDSVGIKLLLNKKSFKPLS